DPAATNGPSCGGVPCNPPGTFFTLYDIPGLVVVSSAAGWNASVQMTGITPGGIAPTDTSLPNVTFTYTGAVVPGPMTTAGFSITSTSSFVNIFGQFSYKATNN